jgi:hypothetical protein
MQSISLINVQSKKAVTDNLQPGVNLVIKHTGNRQFSHGFSIQNPFPWFGEVITFTNGTQSQNINGSNPVKLANSHDAEHIIFVELTSKQKADMTQRFRTAGLNLNERTK